ncbi:DFNB31 family protein [Megaselia abdita]
MRIGGVSKDDDPLTMSATGNDYAELCDLGPSRWSTRSGYHPQQQQQQPPPPQHHHLQPQQQSHHHHHSSTLHPPPPPHHSVNAPVPSLHHHPYDADDLMPNTGYGAGPAPAYGITRIGNSTSSLRGTGGGGRTGLYYSPPAGTAPSKGGSLPGRGSGYHHASQGHIAGPAVSSSASSAPVPGTVPSSTRHTPHNGKKRPISPEQVLRMLGATTSSSVPTSYHYSNGTRDRGGMGGRRSPASSPPSTTHQMYRERDRDRSIPNIHELTTRTVNMNRDQQADGSHGFGVCVKGGKDSGIGVYISRIEEGSVAERAGLRPGDTILEVNGTPFTTLTHEEALKRCVQILKSSRQISMTVRAPPTINSTAPLHGFGPPPPSRDPLYASAAPIIVQPPPTRQTCSWMDRHGRPASPPPEYGGRRTDRRDRIRRVDLTIETGQSLGLMIRGGVEYGLGIFITGVDKDSVADINGLLVGDEILEVNGQSFLDVTHDEAVCQLKYHKRMSLLVRDVGKVPHSCSNIDMEHWDGYSPAGRRKAQISAMVEEKARSLLPRHQYAGLSYYIAEYGARAMTIEAFVSVLLEMLDTYEKHSLVTEIRELIYPEDRVRYDELVYRRVDHHPYDRHREYGDEARSRRGSEAQMGHGDFDQETSMQRLSNDQNGGGPTTDQPIEHNPNVVPDHRGNLHVTIKKTKQILGIAIEGGANTKHPLPRIINIHEHGAAFDAGGLEVGQLILEVDGHKVEGLQHQEVARLIAERFADRNKADITFLVVEAKKSNLEPKNKALIFLEA